MTKKKAWDGRQWKWNGKAVFQVRGAMWKAVKTSETCTGHGSELSIAISNEIKGLAISPALSLGNACIIK
jgi:hypothetical protein